MARRQTETPMTTAPPLFDCGCGWNRGGCGCRCNPSAPQHPEAGATAANSAAHTAVSRALATVARPQPRPQGDVVQRYTWNPRFAYPRFL
jgi:hypothetical protein